MSKCLKVKEMKEGRRRKVGIGRTNKSDRKGIRKIMGAE
jgi:hypothetical protein